MVVATFDAFYAIVQRLTEQNKTLTFSELSGKLLVDGKEPDNREIQLIGANILKLFNQRKVQSITFHDGLTKEELADFFTNILRRRREELSTYAHIALDQTVYVAMVKGEETIVKIGEMVRNSGGEIGGLIKSLRDSYDLIDQLPDAAQKVVAQEKLAHELARQDTSVLRDIFERELPLKIEESGLKPQLLNALSQDRIKDIFGEIAGWYDEIRQKENSDFAAIDQLEKLKKFIGMMLSAPAAREIPRHFFEDLLQKGLLEQLPEWFSPAPSKPATVFEVEKLLERDPSELLENEVLDNLPQMAEKLCQIENTELLGKLVEHLMANFKSPAARLRLLTARATASVYEILQTQNRENLLRFMESPLIDAARYETSAEVHGIVAELLHLRARQNLFYGEYEPAQRIVELLRQQSAPEIMPDEKIRNNAREARRRLAPEIFEVLITDLKSDSEKKRFGSLQLLTRLEDNVIDPLVRVVKESDDIRSRRLAALALKNLGEKARQRFAEELNLGLTADEIKRMVETLGELGNDDMVQQLTGLIRYPDTTIKKDIMRFLSRLNTGQAKTLLIEQLRDQDTGVVSEAVRLLGEIKCSEEVNGLVKMLEDAGTPAGICEELCIALGNIGHPAAVPVLVARLKKKLFLFGARRTTTERIRVRAAWALRRFTGTPVEKALEKASTDTAASIALTARESLSLIRKGTPKPPTQ
jgi:HEAT repeat protein